MDVIALDEGYFAEDALNVSVFTCQRKRKNLSVSSPNEDRRRRRKKQFVNSTPNYFFENELLVPIDLQSMKRIIMEVNGDRKLNFHLWVNHPFKPCHY